MQDPDSNRQRKSSCLQADPATTRAVKKYWAYIIASASIDLPEAADAAWDGQSMDFAQTRRVFCTHSPAIVILAVARTHGTDI